MEPKWLIGICLFALVASAVALGENEDNVVGRKHKNLGIFNIVRFPNAPCAGTGGKNGTCYTTKECEANGGTSAGDCAEGYGVCCIFTQGCGSTVRENCTYFENTGAITNGECNLEVCKCADNICQLRLDFNNFVITGPSTATDTIANSMQAGIGSSADGLSTDSRCMTDTFTVGNPSGSSPPTICGTNTGEHMYVDASDGCNMLSFLFGSQAKGTTIAANRAFSIKISQYSCEYENLAPSGCTQYFFNPAAVGVVKTFNFDGGQHLAAQNQAICVRREGNNCKICWSAALGTDFQISGTDNAMTLTTSSANLCCGYGIGTAQQVDCLVIPGGMKAINTQQFLAMSAVCGRNIGLATLSQSTTAHTTTICSSRQPFMLRFLTDNFEAQFTDGTGLEADKGFRLYYSQTSNNC